MPPVPIAVLVSGRGSNLQALLDATREGAPGRVALVISDRKDAGALDVARHAGVAAEWVSADGSESDATLALLAKHRIGLVVLAGYLKRVSDRVVAAFKGRIVNVHPALLPAFGGPGMYGRRVHEAVLKSGARLSGATVHVVDEQYDHGPVLAQWPVPVRRGDTAELLAARVLAVEHRLLPVVVLACCARIQSGAEPAALAASADAFSLSTTLPDFRHALVPA
ncbi:MAG: phosphoribosylglycinamide formyltransferase [Gemmatimonadales bacterium]